MMKKHLFTGCLLSALVTPAWAHKTDDPLLAYVQIDQLEWRDNDALVLEAEGWLGRDLNKLWIKTDAEQRHGKTQEAEWQALYSHAIAPYWDMQLGLRQDVQPDSKSWAVMGIKGLAPYFFDIDAAFFVGEQGDTAARLSVEYEILFSQKLILTPEITLNAYGQNDANNHTGSGLAEMQAGLRLRYEITRKIAPYIGVNWQRQFGNSADFVEQDGEDSRDSQFVAGIRLWF